MDWRKKLSWGRNTRVCFWGVFGEILKGHWGGKQVLIFGLHKVVPNGGFWWILEGGACRASDVFDSSGVHARSSFGSVYLHYFIHSM